MTDQHQAAGELVAGDAINAIPRTAQPWLRWLEAVPKQGRGPLDDWIEHDIEQLCRAADRLRLATKPTTKHFADMWTKYRKQHERLEENYNTRTYRYRVWRAAALTLLCKRDRFQDEIDAKQARDLLAATMAKLGPFNAAGWHETGGNFWQTWIITNPDGTQRPDPLSEHAVMTISLVRAAMRQRYML